MIPIDVLARLACNDLAGEEERAAEEHVLDCTHCARVLGGMLVAGDALRGMLARARGTVYFPVTSSIIEHLDAAGLITKRYEIPPGGSVACAVTPEDLYSMSTVYGDLGGLVRVDVTFHGQLVADVPFEPTRGSLSFIAPIQVLLPLPDHRVDIKAVGYDAEGRERTIGEYVMNHTGWRG